jgi:hypothetical protein
MKGYQVPRGTGKIFLKGYHAVHSINIHNIKKHVKQCEESDFNAY